MSVSATTKAESLLGRFAGQRPPAPSWFAEVIAQHPQEHRIAVDGADIEALSWGPVGAPGIVFVHGNLAHAHWWSFIAPFFAGTFRVTALSLSGMGGSDHRPAYSLAQFGREILTVADATALYASGRPPTIVAHSAGAGPACYLADVAAERVGAIVVLDSGIRPPAMMPPPMPLREHNRIYATFEDGLAAFRLTPTQHCENLYLVDWIARHALKPVPGGWTWRFDPGMFGRVRAAEAWPHLLAARCPITFINGACSAMTPRDRVNFLRDQLKPGTPFVTIPSAAHHLMLDQPLATVAALDAALQFRAEQRLARETHA